MQSEQTGKQKYANTLLSCFFTTVDLNKKGERSLVISREYWTDIIGVQFNPKLFYFYSLFVKNDLQPAHENS